MAKYFDMLMEDVRMKEGLQSCMNCGVCTGVCPAAEFYNYDPRQIVNIVQTRDDDAIEELLKSDTIWYCGECMSCRPRCPRGNMFAQAVQIVLHGSQGTDGITIGIDMGCQQDMAVALQQMPDFFWCNSHGHQSFFSISRKILSIFIP